MYRPCVAALFFCFVLLSLSPVGGAQTSWRNSLRDPAHHNSYDDDDDTSCFAWTRDFEIGWQWAGPHLTARNEDFHDNSILHAVLLVQPADGAVRLLVLSNGGATEDDLVLPMITAHFVVTGKQTKPPGMDEEVSPSMALQTDALVICGASSTTGTSVCLLYYIRTLEVVWDVSFASRHISAVTADGQSFQVIAGHTLYQLTTVGDGSMHPTLEISRSLRLGTEDMRWDQFDQFDEIGFAVVQDAGAEWAGVALETSALSNGLPPLELWRTTLANRYSYSQYDQSTVMVVTQEKKNCVQFVDAFTGKVVNKFCATSSTEIGGVLGVRPIDSAFLNARGKVMAIDTYEMTSFWTRNTDSDSEFFLTVPMAYKKDAYQFGNVLMQTSNSTIVAFNVDNGGVVWKRTLRDSQTPVSMWSGQKSVIVAVDNGGVPELHRICVALFKQ